MRVVGADFNGDVVAGFHGLACAVREGEVGGDAGSFGEEDGSLVFLVDHADRLGGGGFQPHAVAEIEPVGPDELGIGWDGDRLGWDDCRAVRGLDRKLHAFVSGQTCGALVVVDEDESALATRTDRPAEGADVRFSYGLHVGHERRHGCEQAAEIARHQMNPPQRMIVRAHLTIRTERCLEIIVFYRQVVVVGHRRVLRFHQRGEFALGIDAAMIHIIAGHVAAGPDLADGDRSDVFPRHQDAAVIGAHHAAAEFAGEEGIITRIRLVLDLALAECLGGDRGVGPDVHKAIGRPVVSGHGCEIAIPETLGISAK